MKTTLSSLLSLVEKKTALTEGEVELEFDSTTKVTGAEFATKNDLPQVRVFNREFVNATLSSAGGIAPIYFFGEGSVEKQAQVEKLKGDLNVANTRVSVTTGERSAAESKFDDFCRDNAKMIKELLTTANSAAYNNYDKRNFKRAAGALNGQAVAAAKLSDLQKTLLRSQKDAQPKPIIEHLAVPSLDISALGREAEALINRSIVAQTLDELTGNPSLANWIQQGLAFHSEEHESVTCRFCNQPLAAARRAALESHFNDAFTSFQKDLSALLTKLESIQQGARALRLPECARFYDALNLEATDASILVSTAQSAVDRALGALIDRVEAKRGNPFASASRAAISMQNTISLDDAVGAFNAVVDKHNQTSLQFAASVDDACKKLEASYVAEAHIDYLHLVETVKAADAALEDVHDKPQHIQGQIRSLESQILEHQRPARELTKELSEYLGRDELHFEVKGTGYALTRGGQVVTHLSEGERTAIAFLYFLKSLQDKTFELTEGIVVIDDPVSSLDANALFSAFSYMKDRTKLCGELIVFTHSFPFFRLVKNWFHHLNKYQKKLKLGAQPARFFQLRSRRHVNGSRTSQLSPLDRLLEEHESEYQYLFKRVYEEAHRSDVNSLEHHYGLPNVARRPIEAFLAFRFPDISGDLGRRFERVNFDNARKTRILRLLNTYSHAGAITEPEHDLSLLAETQPVLNDVLEMMKTVDKEHYEGLERLVVPKEGKAAG